MSNVDENLYVQEVEELTNFLRNDADWKDLRDIIYGHGFVVVEIFLVSFYEDEDENEYGVIVTKDKKTYEYTRSTASDMNNEEHFKIIEITKSNKDIAKYPQIRVAYKMIDRMSQGSAS
jgi:hypothetical protein